jgi:hypothetical protein
MNIKGPSSLQLKWQSGEYKKKGSRNCPLPMMKNLLNRLEFHGIGTRALNENDFYKICEAEGIEVLHSPEKFSFYFTMLDHHFIVLPNVAAGSGFFSRCFTSSAITLCMSATIRPPRSSTATQKTRSRLTRSHLSVLIPKSKIKEMAWLDGSRYGSHLYNERIRLFFLYDI